MPTAQAVLLTSWSLAAFVIHVPFSLRREASSSYLISAIILDGVLFVCVLDAHFPSEPAFTTSNYLPALQLILVAPGV